jgi:hypothetical protein
MIVARGYGLPKRGIIAAYGYGISIQLLNIPIITQLLGQKADQELLGQKLSPFDVVLKGHVNPSD